MTYSKGAMAAFDTAARATKAPSDVWTRMLLVVASRIAVLWTRRLAIFGGDVGSGKLVKRVWTADNE